MEKVTFETAEKIKTAIANSAMQTYEYGHAWSDELKLKTIPDRVSSIKAEVLFVPFHEFTKEQLDILGFCDWDGSGLRLIPLWLYQFIPHGIELECINGKKVIVQKDYQNSESENYIDNDIRFGCIAHGIRINLEQDQ